MNQKRPQQKKNQKKLKNQRKIRVKNQLNKVLVVPLERRRNLVDLVEVEVEGLEGAENAELPCVGMR